MNLKEGRNDHTYKVCSIHIELTLERRLEVGGEAVDAGKIDQFEIASFIGSFSFLFFNGHSRPVGNF